MDFDLSEEQRLLKESVDGLLTDSYDFDARKKYAKEKGGWSKAVWGKLAEQGLLGLPFAEADGGFGAGAVETMIVMEALGKAMVLEPYLPTVVIARRLPAPWRLRRAEGRAYPGHHRRQQDLCLCAAREELALRPVRRRHHGQEEGRWLGDRRRKIRRAQRRERRHPYRHRAHQGRPARQEPASACSWCLPNAKGITRKGYPTQDGLHAADVTFTGVEVGSDAAIGDPENALALIERVVDEARTALCAEAVGAMDESLKTTVEYLKTRKQFGVPIGSFQTLQHRAADMFVALEQARSMSMFATMAADFDNAKERATAVAAAKVQIGKSLKFVGQQSIQLHGGIGMTQEAKIGHYFKRLTMIENTFGDTDYHLRRVTDAGGLI